MKTPRRGYKFVLLSDKVRHASEPNNPQLIGQWLKQTQCCNDTSVNGCCAQCPRALQQQNCEQQYRLLMETVLDVLTPDAWREACLNQIYQPLMRLERLAQTDQDHQRIQRLIYELNLGAQYSRLSFYNHG